MEKRCYVVTGAGGFIGRALISELLNTGANVIAVRHESGSKPLPRAVSRLSPDAASSPASPSAALNTGQLTEFTARDIREGRSILPETDAVFNLGGASISARPLTKRRMDTIVNSRLKLLDLITGAYAGRTFPRVLVQASATGIYKSGQNCGEDGLLSDTVYGRMCQKLEQAAMEAFPTGKCRVVLARIGVVTGEGGGICRLLKKLPPFKFFKGANLIPQISLENAARALAFLVNEDLGGPINLTSPVTPSCNELLELSRPAKFRIPLPDFVLNFDRRGALLQFDGTVRPEALLKNGFKFN